MEQSTDGMDATYDLEMEEVGSIFIIKEIFDGNAESVQVGSGSVGRGSPPAQELEDSETEAVWSDGDLNLVANSN